MHPSPIILMEYIKEVQRMLYKKNLKLSVTEGPSKMDLITALAYAFHERSPFYPGFKVSLANARDAKQQELHAFLSHDRKDSWLTLRIQGLEHEDGSGDSFIIQGIIMEQSAHRRRYYTTHKVNGYYSAKTRKGHFDVEIFLADGCPS